MAVLHSFTVLCMIAAVARLHGCTGLSEPRLLTDVIPKSHVLVQLYSWFAFFCLCIIKLQCDRLSYVYRLWVAFFIVRGLEFIQYIDLSLPSDRI